jgi:DNA repair exonuclease SbcCD ATPase subunit
MEMSNFMSFGAVPQPIILDSYPLTMVSGPNGVGKTSAFLDGICYALYGKNFRQVNVDNLTNIHNNAGQVVKLWFSINGVEYIVERSDKGLKLWKEGEPIRLDVGKLEAQAMFQSIIQIDKATFIQMVLMGVKFTSFMDMKADARRKIVEELLDLTVFTVMNEDLNEQIKVNKASIDVVGHEIDKINDRIRLMDNFYNSTKTDADKERDRKEEQIDNWNDELVIQLGKKEDLFKKYDELRLSLFVKVEGKKRAQSKVDIVQGKIQDARSILYKFEHVVNVVNNENEFLNDNTVCPTCTQPIDEGFRATKIETNDVRKQEQIDRIESLKNLIEKFSVELIEYENISDQVDEIADQIRKVGNDISLINENIKNARLDIEAMKQKKSITDRSEYNALIKLRNDTEEKLTDEKDTKRSLEFLKVMLKDTGIKTQIIKSYLPRLNGYISDYLENVMQVSLQYELDENFNGKATLPNRENFEFNSFSEGEKARISLAIMFAWRKIAKDRGAIDTNLLIMDEILDGSLDDQGIDAVLQILNAVNKDENYIVISPRQREFANVNIRELRFSKPNAFTEIDEILP